MPYATNGGVSRADMSGDPAWIEIDEDQYAQALAGMQAGKLVSIENGFALVDPPKPEDPPEPEPEDPNAVPAEVEGWQAEVVMRVTLVDPDDPQSQTVWDRTQDLIAAMPDGIEKITAQTVLARGKIRSDSPTLAMLAAAIPLSSERVHDMLRQAAGIVA